MSSRVSHLMTDNIVNRVRARGMDRFVVCRQLPVTRGQCLVLNDVIHSFLQDFMCNKWGEIPLMM